MVPVQHVPVRRDIIEPVVVTVGGGPAGGVDAQGPVGDEERVKAVGNEIDADGGDHEPSGVDGLAAVERHDSERDRAQRHDRSPQQRPPNPIQSCDEGAHCRPPRDQVSRRVAIMAAAGRSSRWRFGRRGDGASSQAQPWRRTSLRQRFCPNGCTRRGHGAAVAPAAMGGRVTNAVASLNSRPAADQRNRSSKRRSKIRRGSAPGMILRMTILRAADVRSPNAPDWIEFPPAFAQAPHWKGERPPRAGDWR
jgi:hypothetical protein